MFKVQSSEFNVQSLSETFVSTAFLLWFSSCYVPLLTSAGKGLNRASCLTNLHSILRRDVSNRGGILLLFWWFYAVTFSLLCAYGALAQAADLRVGTAGHAFDHLGSIDEQAEAAAASGMNILYVTALGAAGYQGLPPPQELARQKQRTAEYIRRAKGNGIRLAIGYICATSIVKLDTFDQNWTAQFRAGFATAPAMWRQQDRSGQPLLSWYGGDYQPACMNNPDWRAYERFVVRQELEAGCDGIFFDKPTVHPQGCYCSYCLEKFAAFLQQRGLIPSRGLNTSGNSTTALRELPQKFPAEFMLFRCTIARDFLLEMRRYARTIKRHALVTANNSLNSADALYSQCRSYAYNIYELSRAEDFVVVEDMSSQPRMLANGHIIDYGPTYKQLHAISHGKPIVAIALAEADYHTPANLVRLAMAEAAANEASYLLWPTLPLQQRSRMSAMIRPEADFLRRNAALLNEASARPDVVLFLPFRQWLLTGQCKASALAAELARANIQFSVICEDEFNLGARRLDGRVPNALRKTKVLLAASEADFEPGERTIVENFSRAGGALILAEKTGWLKAVRAAIGKNSVLISTAPAVRAYLRDQPGRAVLHLLNLNVQRLSSFEDRVTPVTDLNVSVRVPFKNVQSVRALTTEPAGTSGALNFTTTLEGQETLVQTTLPHLEIASIVVITAGKPR